MEFEIRGRCPQVLTLFAPLPPEPVIDTEPLLARVPAIVLHVMSWSAEFSVPTVDPATGEALRLLATTSNARAVVEVGTGLGVSGLWLLAGLRPDAVLTSIDTDPDHQAMARQCFAGAGVPAAQTRLITGSARTVLPRLADAAYDLVFVDGPARDYAYCVEAAHRLLRAGGLLVIHNALTGEAPVDELRAAREWTATVIPTGAGLLCATKN